MESFRGSINRLFAKNLNISVLQKSRLEWVDYLRGLAIILIVYRHVLIGIQRGNIEVPQIFVDANMIFYSFRMPLFFILSGIFIAKSLAKRSLNQVMGMKFETLLYPYLIWTFIQITLQISLSSITNSNRGFTDYTYIFYQPRELDQFWYLPALFNTTLVYILVKTRLKANTTIQLLLGLGLYFVSPYFQDISMLSDWMAFYFFFALGDAINGLFFQEKAQRFFSHPLSLILIIPIFILAQQYYLFHDLANITVDKGTHLSRPDYFTHIKDQIDFLFIALIGCLSIFILAFRLQSMKVLKFLRILGYHSLFIYVMHVIVTAFVRLSLIIVLGITNPVVILFTSIVIGVTVPVIFYAMFIKTGKLWFLFSYKKPTIAKPLAPSPEIRATTTSNVVPVTTVS